MSYRFTALAFLVAAHSAAGQVEYRNLDGGRPVRIEDATPTERAALDLDLTTLRLDRLSQNRNRLQLEPRAAYGILPNTEIAVRVPLHYREKGQIPRSGVSGVGVSIMRQLFIETLSIPAIALSADAFMPTGPTAGSPAYSAKALLTRTAPWGRLHLNASYGNYSVRLPPVSNQCPGLPSCAGPFPDLPPLDGPCTLSPSSDFAPAFACEASEPAVSTSRSAPPATGPIVSHQHWLAGGAIDKTLPLRSLLLIGDVFAEKFGGLDRPLDWTAEFGARRQISPSVVIDGAVGRHFAGTALSTFVTLGTTITRPFLYARP